MLQFLDVGDTMTLHKDFDVYVLTPKSSITTTTEAAMHWRVATCERVIVSRFHGGMKA